MARKSLKSQASKKSQIVAFKVEDDLASFLDNLPNVCIGVGPTHEGPPEPFLRDFPWKQIPGHPGFAMHLLETALQNDFEPSLSHHLTLDHGFCIPLMRMELAQLPAIVPIPVNGIEPPFMSIRRCLA